MSEMARAASTTLIRDTKGQRSSCEDRAPRQRAWFKVCLKSQIGRLPAANAVCQSSELD